MTNSAPNYDIPALREKLLGQLGGNTADYPWHIEQGFPRIFAKLVELWGSELLEPYLDQLIFSDRTDRQGFPAEVAMELFHLRSIYNAQGISNQPERNVWDTADHVDLSPKRSHKL